MKELCFILEKEKVYLEQALISFNDIPIFFLCKDGKGVYYLALCTDVDEFNYLVVKISAQEVFDLLHQRLTMRQAITNQDSFGEVITKEKVELDQVLCKPMSSIDLEVLPYDGNFF